MGFLPVVFTLLYLESYLGLSEETRAPNAGLRTGGVRNPNLASRCTEARTSPKAGRVAAPRVQPSGASSWPPARLGPWAAQGRWLGEGRMLSGPAEELPRLGGGVTLASRTPYHSDIGPGQPLCIHTRGQEVSPPPPFFPPGAAQAQGLLQPCESRRGRLLPPPPPREPSPAFRVLGPRSQARPGPTQPPGPWVPGAASLAP